MAEPSSVSNALDVVMELILSSSSDSSSSESEDSDDNYYGEIELLLKLLESQTHDDEGNDRESPVPSYTDKTFLKNFRVNKQLFAWLLGKFRKDGFGSKQPHQGGGRKIVLARKHLLSFLWYIGHGSNTFREVCDKFHISKDSFSRVIERCCSFFQSLSAEFISWPDVEESAGTKQTFYEKSNIPNIMGCIDVTHITMSKPVDEPDTYLNQRKLHSIQLQAICDHDGRFLNVSIGFPGAVQCAEVYRNSLIYNSLPHLCQGGYIIGSSEYPLSSWCLTPYDDDGNPSETHKNYNERLNVVRGTIEDAFRKLRQRFAILGYVRLQKVSSVCDLILACCVLHNLTLGDKFEYGDDDTMELEDGECPAEVQQNDQGDGVELRNAIARGLLTHGNSY